MDRHSLGEALAKSNEIKSFLKQMVTEGKTFGSHTALLCENDCTQSLENKLNRRPDQE